jgi:sugar phosphate isomerase/epimerase
MRLRHRDGTLVHLGYGTNVHPAEDLTGVMAQLDTYAAPVRDRLGTDILGLGLWLAAPVAAALAADREQLSRLRRELHARGLEVVTLNGFPYQAFHSTAGASARACAAGKRRVYHPDWTDPRRLAYTLDLASVLAELLPDDAARGSISTLPLGWREPWDAGRASGAARALDELAGGLRSLASRTGRTVRVAFEPEPGCIVETSGQAVARLSDIDTGVLGICLDLAHLACAWEEPAAALARLAAAQLPVVKVQVSAALEVAEPPPASAVLREYAEPRFLHQTRAAGGAAYDDLPEALAAMPDGPWRVHFHVPLHAAPLPPLAATTLVLRAGLAALLGGGTAATDHLEVETYTWSVLPLALRPADATGLAAGLAAEVAFARDELCALGLRTEPTTVEAG